MKKAGEVTVQALITGDQLIGEGQARHETALLEPEDSAKGAREEDALDASEGDQALIKILGAARQR